MSNQAGPLNLGIADATLRGYGYGLASNILNSAFPDVQFAAAMIAPA